MIKAPIRSRSGNEVYALVDDSDSWALDWNWCLSSGYVRGAPKGKSSVVKQQRLSRLVTGASEGMVVDHINHDILDNRCSNLRVCTYAQNSANAKPRKGTSGFKGVSKLRAKWQANICHRGKVEYLGVFDSPEDAARAYNVRAVELRGDFALLNEVS